jgi:hypothetical protein
MLEQSPQMETQRKIRNGIIYIVVVLAFGFAVPFAKGLEFFDPVLLSAYACLGIVFAGPAAAQAFEKRPASLAHAIRWIVKAVLFGELEAISMLACGIATVYAMHRAAFFPPDLESLAYAILLGFAGSLAVASLAAWLALAFSGAAARMAMRVTFFGLLLLFYLKGRWLPNVMEIGTVLCLAAACVFLLLLRRPLAKP